MTKFDEDPLMGLLVYAYIFFREVCPNLFLTFKIELFVFIIDV